MNAVNGQPARLRHISIGLAIACAALLSAGCAAGQHAATAQELPAIDAANGANVGNLQLRALAIEAPATGTSYPKGSDAYLMLTIINTGRSNDTLTGVTTPAATGWAAYPSTAAAAFASSVPSTSAPSSAATSTSPSSGAQTKVVIPAQTSVGFSVPTTQQVLVLSNLTSTLYTAQSVNITFTFAAAGSVTIAVPVQLSSTPATSVIPPAPSSSG